MSLEEVAQRTRLPLAYLILMEEQTSEGKWQTRLLPDPLYLIPHLREYATFLDLDPNIVVAQFTNELQEAQEKGTKKLVSEKQTQLLAPSTQRSRAITFSIVLASVLITLAFIGQYSDMNARAPGLRDNRVLPSSEAPSVSRSQPQPVAPAPAPPASITAPQTILPSASSSQSASSQAASPSSPSPTAAPAALPMANASRPDNPLDTASRADVKTPAASAPQASAGGAAHTLRAQAKEATWIRVLAEGQPPREMILRPGQSAVWTSDSTFQITLGNAGGVTLNLDGQDLPPFGKSGQVIRNIRLPFASTSGQG